MKRCAYRELWAELKNLLSFSIRSVYTQIILGHCRFPLYVPQKLGQLKTWEVTFGPLVRPLQPGIAPPLIDRIPEDFRNFVSGSFSKLFVTNLFLWNFSRLKIKSVLARAFRCSFSTRKLKVIWMRKTEPDRFPSSFNRFSLLRNRK